MNLDPQPLTGIQARVLACLIEKKETTPEQYPLTLNSLRLACNQKTARDPLTRYTEGEVGHAVRELISLGLAREAWGARVPKYEHDAGKALGLQSKPLALLCVLMLRGPQTLAELRTHSQRLHQFDDLEDVAYTLRRLAEHEPPRVMLLPRQPGQKEDRYAHLLSGEPDIPTYSPTHSPPAARSGAQDSLNERITALEARLESALEALDQRLAQLESGSTDRDSVA